jgi:hypothetical protein
LLSRNCVFGAFLTKPAATNTLATKIYWHATASRRLLSPNAITLATTLAKIPTLPNQVNPALLQEYYEYLRENGTTEEYQKTVM